ncbi:MAG: type II toxin-antitoxin system HicA family toxin [Candidatus Muiribacteriaceae bacterium]
MPRIPRDIDGKKFIKILERFGYSVDRQKGSHIRMTFRAQNSSHKLTIPYHNPIKIGTLNNILKDISDFHQLNRNELIEKFFN